MAIYENKVLKSVNATVLVRDSTGAEVPIGRAQEFKIKLNNNLESINELGSDKVAEILEGVTAVSGSIKDLMISFDLMEKALRNPDTGELEYLTLIGGITTKDGVKNVVVSGAKLDGFDFSVVLSDKKIPMDYNFQAIDVKIV